MLSTNTNTYTSVYSWTNENEIMIRSCCMWQIRKLCLVTLYNTPEKDHTHINISLGHGIGGSTETNPMRDTKRLIKFSVYIFKQKWSIYLTISCVRIRSKTSKMKFEHLRRARSLIGVTFNCTIMCMRCRDQDDKTVLHLQRF